jgi:hypothetical protein
MIVCDLSRIEKSGAGWKVGIGRKISGALGLFQGQTLFGSCEEGSMRVFLSTLRLNPAVNYFRMYLEDVRGSLAKVTEIIKDKKINILSGGAFSFGNLWVSEFILDFKGVEVSPEEISDAIEELGGFVTIRELTELFPRSFELDSVFQIEGNETEGLYLSLPDDFSAKVGLTRKSALYAVLKAWPRVKALFIDFYTPETKLLKISARIRDIPGSLNALANVLKTHVDLQALDELHHDEVSGQWVIFGVLVIGELEELIEKAKELPTVLKFEAEPLGWKAR